MEVVHFSSVNLTKIVKIAHKIAKLKYFPYKTQHVIRESSLTFYLHFAFWIFCLGIK